MTPNTGAADCGLAAIRLRGKRAVDLGGGQGVGVEVVIDTLIFPGGYRDQAGYEAITWRVEGSRRYRLPSLDVFTTIRGIGLQGGDFDSLEPAEPAAAAGTLPLSQAGELTGCVLSGDLPCTAAVAGQRSPATIAFSLDLHPGTAMPAGPAHPLTLTLVLDGVTYQVADDWFEDGIQRLERALPPGALLLCCVTCLFSDYSPGGHGLTGIRCHRGAKEQYLAVQSKADYWPVPVTEEVPETYLCEEYQRRTPAPATAADPPHNIPAEDNYRSRSVRYPDGPRGDRSMLLCLSMARMMFWFLISGLGKCRCGWGCWVRTRQGGATPGRRAGSY